MASSTEPRSGLVWGWALGENNWKDGMDNNLLSIGRFAYHLSIKDRNLATPPGTPAAGDSYIVAAAPTGAWVGHTNHVAVWSGTAWVFGTPREGWRAWVEDEDKLISYNGTAWTGGVLMDMLASAAQAVVTLGNTDGEIAALTFSATPTQLECEALRDKAEELADDVRNLSTLLHQIRTDLIAFGIIKGAA